MATRKPRNGSRSLSGGPFELHSLLKTRDHSRLEWNRVLREAGEEELISAQDGGEERHQESATNLEGGEERSEISEKERIMGNPLDVPTTGPGINHPTVQQTKSCHEGDTFWNLWAFYNSSHRLSQIHGRTGQWGGTITSWQHLFLSHVSTLEIHASEAFWYSNLLHYSPYLPPSTSLRGQKRTRKILGVISWLLRLMSCVGLGKFLNFIEPPRAFSSKNGDSVMMPEVAFLPSCSENSPSGHLEGQGSPDLRNNQS